MAHIVSLVYRPVDPNYRRRPDSFLRVSATSLRLLAGYGIEGDAKAGHHPLRQLNILSDEWVLARRKEGFPVAPGDFGEQVVVHGLALDQLKPGDRLQLGLEAWIEITMPRSGCARLQKAQGTSVDLMKGQNIGMLAKIIQSGVVKIGDPVKHHSSTDLVQAQTNPIGLGKVAQPTTE